MSTTPAAAAPAPGPSDIAALPSEVAELRARIAELERVVFSPSPKPKTSPRPKAGYVDVDQRIIDERWNTWVPVYYGDPRYAVLPPSCAMDQFARHSALSCREFRRWFSPHRTHAPNSAQDVRFRKRIAEAVERLPKSCANK